VSTQATVRTLPIRLAPVAGESLDGWLFAYAVRLETPLRDFAAATGLAGGFLRQPARSIAVGKNLPDLQVTAEATGVDLAGLNGLWAPLARYVGAVRVRFVGWTTRRVALPLAWSRFCPQCLGADGDRWKIAWRLPWHTTCSIHHRLLVDACPACGAQQRRRALADPAVEPGPSGRCTAVLPGAKSRRLHICGQDLTAVPVSGGDVATGTLELQQAAAAALDPDACDAALAEAVNLLADLAVIAAHLDAASGVGQPAAPDEIASSLTRALALYRRPADEELAEIVSHDVGRGRGVMPVSWRVAGPALTGRLMRLRDETMRPHERLRWRSTTTPRRPRPDGLEQSTARGRRCPTALWPDWAIRLMPRGGVSASTFREGAAAALRLPGATHPLADLLVGTSHEGLGPTVARTLGAIGNDDAATAILRALTALADGLDAHGSPIDYSRRRQLVSSVELLSARDWDRICAHAGTPTGGDRKLARARIWLFEALTGSLFHAAPHELRAAAHSIVDYHQFGLRLPPQAASLLDSQATSLLAAAGIDEPLTWSPPRDWVDLDGRPGPEPDDIDPDSVNRLLQANIGAVAVAERLGISLELLRHVVHHHPPEVHPRSHGSWRNRSALSAELTPERLRQLVVEEGRGLRDVGREFGVDRKAIAAALEREGIPAGPVGGRPMAIEAQWLRAQYVEGRRPLTELARELGTTPSTVARAAKAHGIPLRSRGGASHARNLAPPSAHLPSPLAEALAGEGGQDRVRRYQVLARCPSVRQAAAIIGCQQPVLHAQLLRLERACGVLVVRSTRSHQPQRLTAVGQALLDQADRRLGPPPTAPADLREPLATVLASFGGEGRVRRFLAVAGADSIAHASRVLGAHQSTLSKQVLGLESSCGGPLLHRCTKASAPHRLTSLGQLLADQATEHLRSAG
jgi:hypothetical protein